MRLLKGATALALENSASTLRPGGDGLFSARLSASSSLPAVNNVGLPATASRFGSASENHNTGRFRRAG